MSKPTPPASLSFVCKIAIPLVPEPQKTILAFLRTSEHGQWKIDDQEKSDDVAMYFIRGNWHTVRSLFGIKRGREPSAVAIDLTTGGMDMLAVPTLLKVLLRPSPKELTICLAYTLFTTTLTTKDLTTNRAGVGMKWGAWVGNEVQSLCQYLKQCHELTEFPSIQWGNAS